MGVHLFAKDLEYLLADCCKQSDVSRIDLTDIAERFDALRGYGRLPRGRENRAKRLSATEIAAAILGLVPANPKWAGHGAIILSDLRPVGGVSASYCGAANLIAVVEHLLTDSAARKALVSIMLSVSEYGTNSHGRAIVTYQQGAERQRAFYVSKMAVSLLQPGMETSMDADRIHSPMSRLIGFNGAYFDRIARAVERSLAFSSAPTGDGSEYNVAEAQQARYRVLGVEVGSRFLNIGVDTQVTWPRNETRVQFGQHHLVLMPKTKENTQSIHVDLRGNRLSEQQALTVINRFLSILTWCDDQFAITQGGWSGNPVPVGVPRRDLAFSTARDWPFARTISESDEVRRALALYREGRNSEEAGLSSYAVLSYFKIVEIKYSKSDKVKKWIGANFTALGLSTKDDPRTRDFMKACGGETPESYIYNACRLAVAHASIKTPSDADDSQEIRRLYSACYVLRQLARRLIKNELGVPDLIYQDTLGSYLQ